MNLELNPVISGTSIGAIVGALHAAGKSGKQIRKLVDQFHISKEKGLRDALKKNRPSSEHAHCLPRNRARWSD
jgi:predicted acylesterase/phospholipase RssA